ncbi:MAG: hypothetical protein KBS86_00855 [Proteobacteria bacterium]|nr:hypothetical protein [Candidatus Enterousia scatequi]
MGLSLIFNKQYRKERALFDTLADKIGKSGQISVEYKGNVECFLLDDMEIHFKVTEPKRLTVVKDGKDIYSVMCFFVNNDSWQQQRSRWFTDLLDYARERKDVLIKKANKKRKMDDAARQVKASAAFKKNNEQAELAKIQKVLDRLK